MFDLSQSISALKMKNQELLAEKELMRDRTGVSSRTSESKSDSESDTQDRDHNPPSRGDRDRLKEISTLNTQLNHFNEPSTPLEELTFKSPESSSTISSSNNKLTNGHSQLESSLSNGSEQ